ncbi:MAG: DoxX family protein [Ktedonobacteraceae bacterium]|jgi:putative oxidoreductase
MNIALWIIQVLVAIMFVLAGFPKAFQPIDALARRLPWTKEVPAWLVRFIGISELLGAVGLILPAITQILPSLTILAAVGLALVMVCAIIFHISRREYSHISFSVILLVLTVFVVYGRWALAPF